jgi:hypothetical protein
VRPGREWDQFEGMSTRRRPARALPRRRCHSPPRAGAALEPPPCRCLTRCRPSRDDLDPAGVRAAPARARPQRRPARRPHRHHLAGRDRLDQSRAWVNRRGLFAREEMADLFRRERIPSTFTWDFSPKGQHMELGIAEMNLFILLSALGLSHSHLRRAADPGRHALRPFHRARPRCAELCLLPGRALHARRDPSGVTLAPEGGAHQSIATPLIGMAQDGLASFEPAFVDELAEILRFAFDYLQRDGDSEPDRTSAPGCATRPAARSTCG